MSRDEYVARLHRALDAVEGDLVACALALRAAPTVYTAGNGGSASTAAHLALDLSKNARPRVRAVCLADAAVVTAYANDDGYERVFAEPLATLASRGDALVVLSVSGNSPSVLAALDAAAAAGLSTVALLGSSGGAARERAHRYLLVPDDDYGVVEDVHLTLCHLLTILVGE